MGRRFVVDKTKPGFPEEYTGDFGIVKSYYITL
jgi:hypothetical protein